MRDVVCLKSSEIHLIFIEQIKFLLMFDQGHDVATLEIISTLESHQTTQHILSADSVTGFRGELSISAVSLVEKLPLSVVGGQTLGVASPAEGRQISQSQ